MARESREASVAILLAAGASSRMGAVDKLWADLAGEPLIARSLRTLASLHAVDLVVAVAPAAQHEPLRALAGGLSAELRCVAGGARRQDSVAAGLAAAPDAHWYLVHDGARPLLTADLACRVLAAARTHGAAVPAVEVADTLKRVDAQGNVAATLDRRELRAAQTPQGFAGPLLRRAHEEAGEGGDEATDDAALVERLGEPVHVVEGDPLNIKVTTAADLALVRALLAAGERGGG